MIIERVVMHIKFGQMKRVRALGKELLEQISTETRGWIQQRQRVLTDLTGDFYTLVQETSYEDLAEYQQRESMMGQFPESDLKALAEFRASMGELVTGRR